MASKDSIYAVIMAGGVGERFWPYSRESRPKQFLGVFTGEPLLLTTVKRTRGLTPPSNVIIVTNAAYEQRTRRLLKGLKGAQVIGEPVGKNTAPAIAAAAALIERRDPEGVMAVLSADHIIRPVPAFIESLRLGVRLTQERGDLVCLGVKPAFAHTGLGYIECGESLAIEGNSEGRKVRRFVEKPDLSTAQVYTQNPDFLWNCGIFVWSLPALFRALERHMPALYADLASARKAKTPAAFKTALNAFYRKTNKESIDYGVLEKADNMTAVKCPIEWNDVGSWNAYRDLFDKDAFGNLLQGNCVDYDSRNLTVVADKGIVATFGLENLYIIKQGDSVLVIPADKLGKVKTLIEKIRSGKNKSFLK
ncbi:MAG: sugar phosphate nucleotidyltransferase [Fibrobacterota bacterium]